MAEDEGRERRVVQLLTGTRQVGVHIGKIGVTDLPSIKKYVKEWIERVVGSSDAAYDGILGLLNGLDRSRATEAMKDDDCDFVMDWAGSSPTAITSGADAGHAQQHVVGCIDTLFSLAAGQQWKG